MEDRTLLAKNANWKIIQEIHSGPEKKYSALFKNMVAPTPG